MSKIIQEFSVTAEDSGAEYIAQVRGEPDEDGRWHGWIEFVHRAGGPSLRTDVETSQMNFQDLEYWASGLSSPYFQGALDRAGPMGAKAKTERTKGAASGQRPSRSRERWGAG